MNILELDSFFHVKKIILEHARVVQHLLPSSHNQARFRFRFRFRSSELSWGGKKSFNTFLISFGIRLHLLLLLEYCQEIVEHLLRGRGLNANQNGWSSWDHLLLKLVSRDILLGPFDRMFRRTRTRSRQRKKLLCLLRWRGIIVATVDMVGVGLIFIQVSIFLVVFVFIFVRPISVSNGGNRRRWWKGPKSLLVG